MKLQISDLWNESLVGTDRETTSRNYLWASQLSKPPVDLWLALRGTPHSNTPNERSRRKFQSGNFFEFMVAMMLLRSGVVVEKQEEIWTRYDIAVKGKGDFVLSGKFDFDESVRAIKAMQLPSEMERMYLQMSDKMRQKYEDVVFGDMAIEVKSVAERTMSRIEKNQRPLESHILQTCHYKLGRGLKEGVVLVLCRDDLRMFEYYVTPEDEAAYVKKVNELAVILRSEEMPPLEDRIVFDDVLGKFNKNLGIEYSNYLTLLYGYEKPMDYADSVKPIIARFNRVLPRIKDVQEGKKGKPTKAFPEGKPVVLTDNNLAAIDEMGRMGFDAYALAKVADVNEEEDEA